MLFTLHTYCLCVSGGTRTTCPNIIMDRYNLVSNSVVGERNEDITNQNMGKVRKQRKTIDNVKHFLIEMQNQRHRLPVGDVCSSRSSRVCTHHYTTIESDSHNSCLWRKRKVDEERQKRRNVGTNMKYEKDQAA